MLWVLLFALLSLWIMRFGFGFGAFWVPLGMAAGWSYFLLKLFLKHEHN